MMEDGWVEVRFCPRCGNERWPGAAFCGKCAFAFAALPASSPLEAPTPAPVVTSAPVPDDLTSAVPAASESGPALPDVDPPLAEHPVQAPEPEDLRFATIKPRRPGEQVPPAGARALSDDTIAIALPVASTTAQPVEPAEPQAAAPWSTSEAAPTVALAIRGPGPSAAGTVGPTPPAMPFAWAAEPVPPAWQATSAGAVAAMPGRPRSRALANATAALGVVGLGLVVAGATFVCLGLPQPGSGFEPITSGDPSTRPEQVLPLGAATVASLIGTAAAAAAAAGAVPKAGAAVLLALAGVVVLVMVALLAGATAWDASGGTLPGPSLLIAGGVALIAAAGSAVLDHE